MQAQEVFEFRVRLGFAYGHFGGIVRLPRLPFAEFGRERILWQLSEVGLALYEPGCRSGRDKPSFLGQSGVIEGFAVTAELEVVCTEAGRGEPGQAAVLR